MNDFNNALTILSWGALGGVLGWLTGELLVHCLK